MYLIYLTPKRHFVRGEQDFLMIYLTGKKDVLERHLMKERKEGIGRQKEKQGEKRQNFVSRSFKK